MSFLPDIDENGILKDPEPEIKLFVPPMTTNPKLEEARMLELNNLGRKKVTEDFADSPFADRV